MTWDEFSSRVWDIQIGFMGEPSEAEVPRGSFHENPFSCICRNYEAVSDADTDDVEGSGGMFIGEVSDEAFSEDDQDWSETEYVDDG